MLYKGDCCTLDHIIEYIESYPSVVLEGARSSFHDVILTLQSREEKINPMSITFFENILNCLFCQLRVNGNFQRTNSLNIILNLLPVISKERHFDPMFMTVYVKKNFTSGTSRVLFSE